MKDVLFRMHTSSCHISERLEQFEPESRDFETARDFAVRPHSE